MRRWGGERERLAPTMEAAETAAALHLQRVMRGHIGRRRYMDALWEAMQLEEEEREARQRDELAAGLALLEQVALLYFYYCEYDCRENIFSLVLLSAEP